MGEENGEKSALVPRLRFPEFRAADGWKEKPLGSICDVLNNKRQPISSDQRKSGPFPYYGASGIVDFVDNYLFDERLVLIGEDGAKWGAFEKTAFIAEGKYWVNNHAHVLRPVEVNDVLLENYLVMLDLGPYVAGAAPPKLTLAKLKWIPVRFPAAQSEQKKIADCLSSLDELITAETQKLDALKIHKKGLMQQLFPREGETAPRLRFPEFREAGEWEQKLIEDFFDVGSSKRVLQQDWTTQGVPFYRTRELVSLSKNEPFGSEIFISEELFCEISGNYGLPAEGDFLVSGVGTLGISYQVQAQDRFYFKDGNVLWFKLKGGIVSTFFKYCFEADEIQNQILGQASISTVGTYTIQNAKVTKFSCPTNIEEQQEIADCLSSLDDLITAQSQKIDALKTHKKGLMQQLFPVLDEAPG